MYIQHKIFKYRPRNRIVRNTYKKGTDDIYSFENNLPDSMIGKIKIKIRNIYFLSKWK